MYYVMELMQHIFYEFIIIVFNLIFMLCLGTHQTYLTYLIPVATELSDFSKPTVWLHKYENLSPKHWNLYCLHTTQSP